jgi:hypothetical protein
MENQPVGTIAFDFAADVAAVITLDFADDLHAQPPFLDFHHRARHYTASFGAFTESLRSNP